MGLLLRKVIAAKWLKNKDIDLPEFSSDPITVCNKTSGDTLSVWRCDSMDFENDDTLQMIVAGLVSAFNAPTPHDFLFLDDAELAALGLNVHNNKAATSIKEINSLHADITGVNYTNLGIVSKYIRDKVCEDNAKMLVLTKEQVIDCVRKFYVSGKLKKRINDDSPWAVIKETPTQ
ncbi:hypothetical protein K3H43_00045 [Aeromonas veronii]|uniref:hypothetical protein n=1 Tax=Aeromonas veronii TaxID=654 RepID=UPI001F2BD90B|nr:hypothetical protein [Aeromonas veronii]MCF5725781.1 hypothetical protein [Aeromonas veronii]